MKIITKGTIKLIVPFFVSCNKLRVHIQNIAIFKKSIDKYCNICYILLVEINEAERIFTIMESKREKFVRLAETRTNKIIDMIRLLGNCANKANYDYSEADVQKIFSAIEKEIKTAKTKFSINEVEDKFKL